MICPNCNNDGFIISNRVYEFHSIMDYDGKILTSGPLLNLLKSDKLQQIYASSLRTVFNLENHLPDETERIKIQITNPLISLQFLPQTKRKENIL